MTFRVLIMAGAVLAACVALRMWRQTPRLSRVDLDVIGATGPAIVQFGTPTCAVNRMLSKE